jgi:hypothetical protein
MIESRPNGSPCVVSQGWRGGDWLRSFSAQAPGLQAVSA